MNASRNRRPVGVILVALALALAVAAVPAALAAKGGNGTNSGHGGNGGGNSGGGGGHGSGGGSSSLTLVMVTDLNGDGAPNWGDTISFAISTTQTDYPYVSVRCYQNGTLVYSADAGYYDGYLWPGAQNMPLSSPSWTGGAASCTAVLNDGLATLSFDVGA